MRKFRIDTKQNEPVAYVTAESKRDVELYLYQRTDLPMHVRAESRIIEDEHGYNLNEVNTNAQRFKEMGYSQDVARRMAEGRDAINTDDSPVLPIVHVPEQDELAYRSQSRATGKMNVSERKSSFNTKLRG